MSIAGVVAIGAVAVALAETGARDTRVVSTCERPYTNWSPWNTPIVSPVHDNALSRKFAALREELTSDPNQYTYPVYEVSRGTRRVSVRLEGLYSHVGSGGRSLTFQRRGSVSMPLPEDAVPARGSDGQIIVVDTATGDEWGGWRFSRSFDGSWRAVNAYHYNTRWSGVPPLSESGRPFGSRGAGVPYLTGLVRPCEIRRGAIRHALAFAYPYPSREHVYPATKSDGAGSPYEVPEGTRLQLDPTLGESELRSRGCSGACLTIARALKRYGMYVIDNSGRPKVMMEYGGTAHWDDLVSAKTPSPIPLARFKAVVDTAPTVRALASAGRARRAVHLRYVVFDRGDATRETVTVEHEGRRIATLKRPFHVPTSRAVTSVEWTPRQRLRGLVFCVRAADPAGHQSRRSCRPLRVR